MSQSLESSEHPAGRPLVITLIVLLMLTAISWAISNVELGWLSTVVALVIAAIKAGIVLYWFMELPFASTSSRIVVFVTLSFIALLCAGAVADIALR